MWLTRPDDNLAQMELTDEILRSAGGMSKLMRDEGLQAKIVFRAKKNATVIPASALRSEGNSEYIFVAETSYGGFLSSGSIKVKNHGDRYRPQRYGGQRGGGLELSEHHRQGVTAPWRMESL